MRVNSIFSLIISGLAVIVIIYFMQTDPYRAQAERYVRGSPRVQSQVGAVADVSLRRLRTYQGSDLESPYREYQFSVAGSRGRAQVIVRAYPTSVKEKYEFNIQSIESS